MENNFIFNSITSKLLLLPFVLLLSISSQAQDTSSDLDLTDIHSFLTDTTAESKLEKPENKAIFIGFGLANISPEINEDNYSDGLVGIKTLGINPALSNTFRLENRINILGRKANSSFHVGIGLQLVINYFVFKNDIVIENADTLTMFHGRPFEVKSTKLRIGYIGVPLTISYIKKKFNGDVGFHASIGGYVDYKIFSKTRLRLYGKKILTEKNNYNLEKLQYGATVSLGYGPGTLFGTYALSPMFDPAKGPKEAVIYTFGVKFGAPFN